MTKPFSTYGNFGKYLEEISVLFFILLDPFSPHKGGLQWRMSKIVYVL